MKVLVTGSGGFIGRNLCATLLNISTGKDRRERYQELLPLTVFESDSHDSRETLSHYCSEADFVFNLAGVNRPDHPSEYTVGNAEYVEQLLELLAHHGNACPVMLASSVQASLEGRYAGSEYGKSKRDAERLLFEHARRVGAEVLVYRFPNVYGKWCRPNYNSAVATFCYNVAHGLPVTISDPDLELELLYIDDLVDGMLEALRGQPSRCGYDGIKAIEDPSGAFCRVTTTDRASLGEIVGMLEEFASARKNISVPNVSTGSLSKKLYSTYLSYLDPLDFSYCLGKKVDERGSFTEFLRTNDRGQISVNVSKPGVTKGNHWHHTKWEKFLVVSGNALIRIRQIGRDGKGELFPVMEYRVSGDCPTVVEMVPGYTHSITNLSDDHDLVTLMWANEPFDLESPDTYTEIV